VYLLSVEIKEVVKIADEAAVGEKE